MSRRDDDYVQRSDEDSDVPLETVEPLITPSAKAKGKGRVKSKPLKRNGKGKEAYSWEASYTRSWDAVQEDEDGSLQGAVGEFLARQRRRRLLGPAEAIRRTIIRHLILVLDLSASMTDRDMRPNRFDLMLEYSREFVVEWFDQNPLGQIGIVAMREGIAERICGLTGNPPEVQKAIADRRKLEPSGEPSLQNAVEMAKGAMSHLPSHSSREILIIFGSLTSCDPGNIHNTLRECVNDKLRISVIALAAEMKICRDFADNTGGTFGVALNEGHFRDMFFDQVPPPAIPEEQATSLANGAPSGLSDLMMMGFPTRLPDTSLPTLCVCHGLLKSEGYLCPRCLSKVCNIPTDCNVCGLMIVSAPHLARSYHHLFPVKAYEAVTHVRPNDSILPACFGCNTPFPLEVTTHGKPGDGMSRYGRYRCPECKKDFCSECDVFVHDVMHVCPGCESQEV